MSVTIMIDGSVKRNRKFGFELQSSHSMKSAINTDFFFINEVIICFGVALDLESQIVFLRLTPVARFPHLALAAHFPALAIS